MKSLQDAALDSILLTEAAIADIFSQNADPKNRIVNQTLKNLFWYLSSRSRAVSLLVSYGYCWDAEIVLRSFYETAAKILYICFSPDGERESLMKEYWNDFEEINDRRTAQKAEHAEKLLNETGSPSDVMAALQDGKVFKISATKPKHARRKIEQKWSFVEIINQLNSMAKDGLPLRHITALLHIYGMASHLIHADKNAMDLMHDRATRNPDEREIVAAAHIARIMSDQVHITRYCYEALRYAVSGSDSVNQDVADSIEIFSKMNKPIQDAFSESQKEFYHKLRENK